MDENEPSKYTETIVLEILDRPRFWFQKWRARKIEKFNIARFNATEAAYAFLRQYDRETFVKAQKIIVWYNNQELHLCVRDLIYGNISNISNSTVEFIYRKALFSEIKWPVVTVNRISRVQWANDQNESTLDVIQPLQSQVPAIHTDSDYSSINVDEPVHVDNRVVSCMLCKNSDDDQSLSMNSTQENTMNPFCRGCQLRRSVSGLQKLINNDEGSLTLEHSTDDENHFRTSIHIRINQNINP